MTDIIGMTLGEEDQGRQAGMAPRDLDGRRQALRVDEVGDHHDPDAPPDQNPDFPASLERLLQPGSSVFRSSAAAAAAAAAAASDDDLVYALNHPDTTSGLEGMLRGRDAAMPSSARTRVGARQSPPAAARQAVALPVARAPTVVRPALTMAPASAHRPVGIDWRAMVKSITDHLLPHPGALPAPHAPPPQRQAVRAEPSAPAAPAVAAAYTKSADAIIP